MNVGLFIHNSLDQFQNLFLILVDDKEQHKCMVRLLKMSLDLNEQAAEAFLSPTKNGSNSQDELNNEEIYVD